MRATISLNRFLGIGLIFSGALSWAETQGPRLEDVLNSVDQHYPEILGAGARAQAQESLITRARGAFDPVLGASIDRTAEGSYQNTERKVQVKNQIPGTGVKIGGEWSDLDGKVPVYDGDRATGVDGRLKGFVEVPLLRDLVIDRARAALDTALLKYSESLENARLVRLDTYRLAALAYWGWHAALEKQRVFENLLRIAEERDQVIGTRVKRGEAPRIDAVDNQRMILQRKAQVEKTRAETLKAALILSLFYRTERGLPNRPGTISASWLRPLTDNPASDSAKLRAALEEHPLLLGLQKDLEQKRVAQRLAKYNLLPELDFKLSHSAYQGETPPPRELARETRAGLLFAFPLFNRDARGASGAARLEADATEQKMLLARQKLEVDFEKAILESNASANIYKFGFQEIDFAAQVEQAERMRFQQGDSSLLNVNLREQDTAFARVRAIDSLLDFHQKDLEVHLITNTWLRKY